MDTKFEGLVTMPETLDIKNWPIGIQAGSKLSFEAKTSQDFVT